MRWDAVGPTRQPGLLPTVTVTGGDFAARLWGWVHRGCWLRPPGPGPAARTKLFLTRPTSGVGGQGDFPGQVGWGAGLY